MIALLLLQFVRHAEWHVSSTVGFIFFECSLEYEAVQYRYFLTGIKRTFAGIDEKALLQAVDTAVEMNQSGDYNAPVPDYADENVSSKVIKIIQSYTGVVNKVVWRKA